MAVLILGGLSLAVTDNGDGTFTLDTSGGGEANPAAASQAEAEAGTEAALRTFSPLRVAQAIAALGGGGSGPVWTEVEIDLTNAELLALNSVPKQLVAAPSAGNILDVLRIGIRLDSTAGLYIGGGALQATFGTQNLQIVASSYFTGDGGIKRRSFAPDFFGTVSQTAAALSLTNASADFTGGNAANKATVNVIYRVVAAAPN